MKRMVSLLLTAAMTVCMLSGCAADTAPTQDDTASTQPSGSGDTATTPANSYEAVNNGIIDVTATDVFGEHSITILGDSMPHGSQTVDIMNNSWPNILKKAINEKSGDNNYGFTSIEGTLWGHVTSHEIHSFPESSTGYKNRGEAGDGWTEYRTAELLGTKGLGSSVAGATLTLSPKKTYNYFCVYYQSGPAYGSFEVCDSEGNALTNLDSQAAIDCYAEEATYARTAFYDMSKLGSDNKIVLRAVNDKEVIFTGIGYYDTPGGVVVSNYSNGGLQLAGTGRAANGDMTGLDKKFIDLATESGTVIFSLGYNDAYFATDMDLFEEKIDYLIECANKKGTKIIVNDTCWDKSDTDRLFPARYPRVAKVKAQLKRLAEETGGVYIDQQAIHGQALLDTCDDGVHPNADGHAMLARSILTALGLQED